MDFPLRSVVCAGALCAGLVGAPAAAAPPEEDPYDGSSKVRTILYATPPYIVPGEDILLSVRFLVDDEWHIYWPGTNDTGYGASFELSEVDGLTYGETVWPTPERYRASGGILDHVYEGRTKLFTPVEVSEDLEIGTTVSITLTTDFLVCRELCLPGSGEFVLELPVIDGSRRPMLNLRERKMVSMYENRPTDLDPAALSWRKDSVDITIDNARRYEFFPGTSCTTIKDLYHEGEQHGRSMTLAFDADAVTDGGGPRLEGRLRVLLRDDTVLEFDVDAHADDNHKDHP